MKLPQFSIGEIVVVNFGPWKGSKVKVLEIDEPYGPDYTWFWLTVLLPDGREGLAASNEVDKVPSAGIEPASTESPRSSR